MGQCRDCGVMLTRGEQSDPRDPTVCDMCYDKGWGLTKLEFTRFELRLYERMGPEIERLKTLANSLRKERDQLKIQVERLLRGIQND